jgi:hypothetical protein
MSLRDFVSHVIKYKESKRLRVASGSGQKVSLSLAEAFNGGSGSPGGGRSIALSAIEYGDPALSDGTRLALLQVKEQTDIILSHPFDLVC